MLEVHGSGVGNWDDIARSGGWDLGRHPPMALSVEAAGVVAATGAAVAGVAAGEAIIIPPGAWAGGLAATLLIGAADGLLPAIRAARLSPTQALWSI